MNRKHKKVWWIVGIVVAVLVVLIGVGEAYFFNVAFVPGEPFYPDKVVPGTFRLNYSNMSEDQIKTGIKRLGTAIKETIGVQV